MGTASILSPLDVRLEDCQLSEASRWDPQRRANVQCPPRRSSPWGAGKSRPRTWCGSCSWRRRSTGSRRRGRTCRACTGAAPFISLCRCGCSRSCPNSGDLPSVRSLSSRVLGGGWGEGSIVAPCRVASEKQVPGVQALCCLRGGPSACPPGAQGERATDEGQPGLLRLIQVRLGWLGRRGGPANISSELACVTCP